MIYGKPISNGIEQPNTEYLNQLEEMWHGCDEADDSFAPVLATETYIDPWLLMVRSAMEREEGAGVTQAASELDHCPEYAGVVSGVEQAPVLMRLTIRQAS